MSSHSVSLRQAEEADASSLAAIHSQCFDTPWSAQDFSRFLVDSHFVCLCANDGKTPVGFLLCRTVMEEAEIITFAVLPENRRRGIGAALVDSMKDVLRGQGVQRWFLEVSDNNEAAIALYRSAAFLEVGARKSYYAPGATSSKDALVMQCSL